MAVLAVNEEWTGESGGWQSTGEPGGFSGTLTRSWNVTLDATTNTAEISLHPDIPKPRESHPYNPWYRAGSIQINRLSPIFARVSATYEANNADDGNPLSEPPRFTYASIISEGDIDEDANGEPICTTNGEPLRGAKKPFADLSLTIQRNLLLFDPTSIYTYVNTTNSATFLGFPAGTARLVSISANNVIDDDFSYWDVSVEFQFRKPINTSDAKAWWLRLVNEGFKVKHSLTGEIVHAVDGHQKPAARPVLLNQDGTQDFNIPPSGSWVEFQIFESTDFNSLGLL